MDRQQNGQAENIMPPLQAMRYTTLFWEQRRDCHGDATSLEQPPLIDR